MISSRTRSSVVRTPQATFAACLAEIAKQAAGALVEHREALTVGLVAEAQPT